ncbi:MAG: ATP-binding protein, partial [Candidatus Eremiobacterota bacterium]
MDEATLNALLSALEFSPDNTLLRVQVVRELLRARRWTQAGEVARPLLNSDHRPLGLVACARAAMERGHRLEAGRLYREALEHDRSLVDEGLEAELEVDDTPMRVKMDPEEDLRVETDSRPRITFDDVGGMESLKEQIRLNILYPMQRPELYEAYGKKVGGGMLMFGPPGCGK